MPHDDGDMNMRQVALKSIAVACLASSICRAGLHNAEVDYPTNSIAAWYLKTRIKLAREIEEGVKAQSSNVVENIIAAGNLRLIEPKAILFESLGKSEPRLRIKSNPAILDHVDFSSTPIVISFDSSESMSLNYPAFYALSMIAPDFESCRRAFLKSPQRMSAMEYVMLSRLAFYSGGNYFTKLFDSRALTISGEYSHIVTNCLHLSPLPSAYLPHRQGQDDMSDKYIQMQKAIIRQFKDGIAQAGENIPDTIATMGYIRSLDAIPVLADNLTICPQASTNAPGGFVFPAVEALISIGPAIGDCFERLKATTPLSVEEALWLRISHELYPEGLEYELYCAAATNDTRAARLLQSLPWRRLSDEDCEPVELRQEMIEGKKQTEMKGDD